jgi:hypothetical protein
VAVLVAVGFLLSCLSVRRGARPISLVSIAMKRFMRLCAALCETLQKHHLGTQNPPMATSWGFDPLPAPIKSVIYEINASSDAFFCAQTVPKLGIPVSHLHSNL